MREQVRSRGARRAGSPLLVLPVFLWACRAAGAELPQPPGADPAGRALPLAPALPRFEGLAQGLGQGLAAALEDGEDELARTLVERLEPLSSTPEERAFLESCRRILAGREVLSALRIEFVLDASADAEPYPDTLYLEFLQSTDAPLTLHLPPADLELLRTWVTPEGIESRALAVRPIAGLERLLLPPGVARRIEIGPLRVWVPGALAVRDTWQVVFRSGELERGGESLPVRAPSAPPFERTNLAPGLEPGDTAAELAAALGDPARAPAELLLLAVRIQAEGRDAALAGLAPEVARLAREAPERLRAVAPAQRRLARAVEPGADPGRWAAWFRAWSARRARERADADGDPRLELPGSPRIP